MSDRSVRAILIIRLSALGDVVMATPLARALRARYPDAHIAWLVQPEGAPLIEAHPDIDEVIVWPRGDWRALARRGRWLRLTREARAFARRLREPRFDLVIDCQGLLKSGVWAWLSGASQRIGLGSREGSAWLMTQVVETARDDPRVASEYRDMASSLGLPGESFEMRVGLTDEDAGFARRFAEEHGLGDRYAVLCPFTTRPQKHWVGTRWRDLAARLHADLGLRSVIVGGGGDTDTARRIVEGVPEIVVNAAGETTLRQAAALIARARLVVGVDTGMTHVGLGSGVPTLALFGSTRPYLETGRDDAVVIYKNLWCSPCRRRPICGGEYSCMGLITVDEVVAAARGVLR